MFRFVLACSQTLYFLFKVRRGRVIKNKNRGGFADRQRKGLGVEKEKILYFSFSRSALVFARRCSRKNEKKKKITSVHRLVLICSAVSFFFFKINK